VINAPINTPQLLNEVEQRELTQKHQSLEISAANFKAGDAIDSLGQALRYFEDRSRADRQHLIATNTLKTRGDLIASKWICTRYQHLLAMAFAAMSRSFAGAPEGKASPAQGAALVMVIAAHLVKWRKYSGGRADNVAREYAHIALRHAQLQGVDSAVLTTRIDERIHETTVEALYLRAMLLERFSGGSLSPKRFEILDTWLTTWMGALWLTREPNANEPMLALNLADIERGLIPYVPLIPPMPIGETEFFLSLRPIKRQLDRAIHAFHQGTIFPGWGVGVAMKVDEHVAVIEFLERELQLIDEFRRAAAGVAQGQAKPRGKRVSLGINTIVAVYFGFNEIATLAFDASRAHSVAGGGGELGIRNAIRLLDISEGGLGLEMVDEDARRLHVNDLVAIRIEKGRPAVLGFVARKSTLQRPTGTLVGIKVLTKTPLKRTMDRVNESNSWQPCEGIFVAGLASDGFQDSVVMSEADYVANSLVAVTLQGRVHEFYARRVREQGNGWRMVAIDAIDRSV
jgi:hypothetical protein